MVFEELAISSSPFLIGISVFIGLALLLGRLRAPMEVSVMVLFPTTFIVVGSLIQTISPIITLGAGLVIGWFFLYIVRR